MMRRALLGLSDSAQAKHLVTSLPTSKAVVARFVAGETTDDAMVAATELAAQDLFVSLDHLGEDTGDIDSARSNVAAYDVLLRRIAAAGLSQRVEVSIKLSAIGASLGRDRDRIALDNARQVCAAAQRVGTTVTVDAEDHTTTDLTLGVVSDLRQDFPETGVVVQSCLRRTESDCRDLAYEGSRVRLCKGAYDEPQTVAYADSRDVDKSYVRCLRTLMLGQGHPMVATHDPRLISIAGALATRSGRVAGTYEFQMLYGVRPVEQQRLAVKGEQVRVYVPYGSDWYGYLLRRMAERPANMGFFLRSLVTTK